MQIVTRCDTVDEFIDQFAAFTTETYIVVPALPEASEGGSGHFVISLRDGSVMMKGRCEVTEVRSALMRLRLREMDAHSAGIHLRLMESHAFSPEPQAEPAAEAVVTATAAPAPETETTMTPPPPPSYSQSDAVPAHFVVAESSAVTVVGDTRPPSDNEITVVSPASQTSGAADATAPAPGETFDVAARADRVLEQDPPTVTATRPGFRLRRVRRSARSVAPYAVGLAVGLLVGLAIKSGSKAPVTVAPQHVSASAPAPAPAAAPSPVAPPPPVATPPEDEPTSPVAAAPDDEPMPPSGSRHGAQRSKGLASKVIVTSTPPRAFIKVNRHRQGRAPREISAPRFERVRFEASLPGYKRWKKTLYLEEAEVNLEVKLVRVRELAARHSSASSATPTPATPPASGGVADAIAAR